jgi:hypothetical protein
MRVTMPQPQDEEQQSSSKRHHFITVTLGNKASKLYWLARAQGPPTGNIAQSTTRDFCFGGRHVVFFNASSSTRPGRTRRAAKNKGDRSKRW